MIIKNFMVWGDVLQCTRPWKSGQAGSKETGGSEKEGKDKMGMRGCTSILLRVTYLGFSSSPGLSSSLCFGGGLTIIHDVSDLKRKPVRK